MKVGTFNNISFGTISSQDFVKVQEDCLKNNKARSTTYWFRQDIEWSLFTDYLIDEMPKNTKIYNFACSDGSEIFSLKMKLDEKLKYNPENKNFEYYAFDINKKALEKAKNKILTIESMDKLKFENKLAYGFDKYFKKLGPVKNRYTFCNPQDFEDIKFEYGDITKWAKNKQDKPCVVMFRNAWGYLKPEFQKELAEDLYKNLPKGSLLVIGDYDTSHYRVMQNILFAGFNPVNETALSCFDDRVVYKKG